MKDESSHVKQWVTAVLAWSLLGCEAVPAEPPPKPDHLAEDVKRLGEDLLACRQAEHDRLLKEKVALEAQIAEAKAQIATNRLLVGEDEYRRIMGEGGRSHLKKTPGEP